MSPQPHTVFLVDDSATMREVLKAALRRLGMVVVPCADGEKALHSMEQLSPDIVVSDILMPECDGFELCRRLRQHATLAAVPVILISSVVTREVAEQAAAAGASELMRKPFQPHELIARVLHLLRPGAAAAGAAPAQDPPRGEAPGVAAPATAAALPESAVAVLTEAMRLFSPPPQPAASPLQPTVAAAGVPAPAAGAPDPAAPAAAVPSPLPSPDKRQMELQRLQALVRKLQSDVSAERE